MTLIKKRKLKHRCSLSFTSISFFATIVLSRIVPALAKINEKTAINNNTMDVALFKNVLELFAGLLLAISLVAAIAGICLMIRESDRWEALGTSLLGFLVGFLMVLIGCGLILGYWTPALSAIAWANGISFFVFLEFALTH